MPTYQTTGIVIGRTNFGEADRVIRFLTPDRGKLSAVARGVRKIKSRAGGHLELFGEVTLMLATGRNLDVITSARLQWYPHQLSANYDRLGLAFAAARAIDQLTEPDHPAPAVYRLLRATLAAIDTGATGPLPELWFKLQLLDALGYRPELGRCLVCGTHDPDTTYAFSPDRGGIVCAADAHPGDHPISPAVIKLWRLLSDYPYESVARIADAPALAASSLPACDAFYQHHLGRTFQPGIS